MKIAIITSGAGGGHNSAARNLANSAPKGTEVKIFQLDDYLPKPSRFIFITSYFGMSTIAGGILWGLFYNLSNTAFGARIHYYFHKFFLSHSRTLVSTALREFNPDQIISTIFLGPYFLTPDLAKLPHHLVITDFSLHRFWYHPDITTYFVANTQLANDLKKINSTAKIIESGIPVDPLLYNQTTRSKKSNQPQILLLAGGTGLAHIDEYVAVFLTEPNSWSITVICGQNKALMYRLQKMVNQSSKKISLLGWTDSLSAYLLDADVVITKPGGLSTSECLAAKKPMILINPIPGQERANADFLITNTFATLVTSPKKLFKVITDTIASGNAKNRTSSPVRPAVHTIWENII